MLSMVTSNLLGHIFSSRDFCIQLDSTQSYGHSSHEIIFNSPLRDPLSLLSNMWVRPGIPQHQTHNLCVSDLRQRIIKVCQLAKQSRAGAAENQREYCNRGMKLPVLKPNDEVLILFPDKSKHYYRSNVAMSISCRQTLFFS